MRIKHPSHYPIDRYIREMLLSSASRESAAFPKSPYHQEKNWKSPTFPSKSELSEELLYLRALLFYPILKAAIIDDLLSQCLFLSFLLPCALHYIKHYRKVNSPTKAFTPRRPENPGTLSQSGNLSHVLVH